MTKTYSYHKVDPHGPAQRGFAVVENTLDEHGDVIDTNEVAFFKSEAKAQRKVDKLNNRNPGPGI